MEIAQFLTEKLEIENIFAINKKEQKSISKYFLPTLNFSGKKDEKDYSFECRYTNNETILDLYLVDFIPFSESGIKELTFERYCIIYLCDFDIENDEIVTKKVTGSQFIFSNTTKEILHIYISKEVWKRYVSIDATLSTSFRNPEYEKSIPESRFILGYRSKGLFKKNESDLPLISVIMPTFNSEKTIEQSIQSVIYQNYPNYELLLIDGLSKDKTLEIVKKYEKYIDGVLSEKDKNIYDAMNKGILLSRGEYSVCLGSDDLLMPYSIETVIHYYQTAKKADYYYGDGLMLRKNNKIHYQKCFIKSRYFNQFKIMHNSLYVKKRAYLEVEGFNIEYDVCADTDFELKLITTKKNSFYINRALYIYRDGGYSSLAEHKIKQVYKIYKTYNAINIQILIHLLKFKLLILVKNFLGEEIYFKIRSAK